jgi:Tol biopolymer transport system component
MKLKIVNLIFCLLTLTTVIGQSNSADKMLNKAIYQEEVNGDLQKAIEMYEMIVKDFPNERKVVAKALYRNAFANEKLGLKTASVLYQKIISNYADQTEMVNLSKKRLKSLSGGIANHIKKGLSVEKIFSFEDDLYGMMSHNGKYLTHTDWGDANLYYIDIATKERFPITTNGVWKKPMKYADFSIWSPKDDKIAFAFYDETSGYSLNIWDKATKKTTTVLKAESTTEFVWPMDWAKDGRYIVTVSGDRKSLKFGLLDLSTKKHKTFNDFNRKTHRLLDNFPSISPDGKYILYSTLGSNGNEDIFAISTESGIEKTILDHMANEGGQIWGKDGKSFLFVSDRSGAPVLYKHKFENGDIIGEPELIYEGINESFIAHVNNDAGLIFNSSSTYSDIYIADINLETGTISNTTVFQPRANRLHHPVWSNNGNYISYTSRKVGAPREEDQLIIRELATGTDKIIDLGTGVEFHGMNSLWSKDDKKIALESQNQNIIVVDIEKETVDVLKDIGATVAFGPDNSIISSKRRESNLIKVDLETKTQTTLFEGKKGWDFFGLKITPDKKNICFYEFASSPSKRLGMFDLTTGKYELLLELKNDQVFARIEIISLPNDNNHIIVGIVQMNKDGNLKEVALYKINIHTKEKEKFGLLHKNLNDNRKFDFSRKLDKIVFKKGKSIDNIWLLK